MSSPSHARRSRQSSNNAVAKGINQSVYWQKGKKEKLFYKEMIALAEQTYDDYLSELTKEQENEREI